MEKKNIQWHTGTSPHFSFPAATKPTATQAALCVVTKDERRFSLHSEEAHKAAVSIASYSRQQAISSLFRHPESLMQIGNRQSQCFLTEGMGAPVYLCGFSCQTWWSIFHRESNRRVCEIFVERKWFPWIDSFDASHITLLHVILCRSQQNYSRGSILQTAICPRMDSALLHTAVAWLWETDGLHHETCGFIYKLTVELKVQREIIYQCEEMLQN